MKRMKKSIVTRIIVWMMVAMLSTGGLATINLTDTHAATYVLVTKTGKKYHKKACCRGNFYKVTLEAAKSRHLSACKTCYKGKAPSTKKKTSTKKTTKKFNFSLSKTKIVLKKGETKKLKIKGTKKKAKWSTSKKSIATVSAKGKIKARKKGTTYIKAKINGKIRKCKVIVK